MSKGVKSSEFWLTAVTVLNGLLMSSGIWGPDDAIYKALAFLASVLAALGYTWSRTLVKKGGGQ